MKITIVTSALFIILALGTIVFLFNQNQGLKNKLATYQTSPAPQVETFPSPTPSPLPTITSPSVNSKIKSPVKITGTVPSGWMFEGVFPVKLIDINQNVLAEGTAKEVTPGSWQSGNPVDFTATLTFKVASGEGVLVLENDNPSGDPANSKTYEIPVSF